jgi:dipeptidase D
VQCDTAPAGTVAAQLKVLGLKGGHSGLEIDKGRGNAIKIINRVLLALHDQGARLCSMEGGNKHNAIPREADAFVLVPEKKWDAVAATVDNCNAVIKSEFATAEPDLSISIARLKGKKPKVLKKALQKKLLQTLSAMPHGVIKMSADIPGLVETSTNLAVIKSGPRKIEVVTSQRSSVASEIQEICQSVESIFDLGGAAIAHGDGYPGWKPNLDSYILKTAVSTYQSLYGKEPAVKAIHAGLECGIIGEKCPGMDMVSMGPTLEGVHSPDEKIYIDTVEKYWDLLLAILKNVD